jgi:hypothetical protein
VQRRSLPLPLQRIQYRTELDYKEDPLPRGLTLAEAEDKVKNRPALVGNPPEILGASSDSERAALLWHVAAYSNSKETNTREYRLILPLQAGGEPKAKVILTYPPPKGRAKAELIERLMPGTSPSGASSEQARAEIGKYGCTLKGPWKPEELDKLVKALALLVGDEKTALRGVCIQRVDILATAGQGGHGGKRHPKAHFSHEIGPAVADFGLLEVADAAFADDDKGFFGGAGKTPKTTEPSVRILLHEIGHATETKAKRDQARQNAEKSLSSVGPDIGRSATKISQEDVNKAGRPQIDDMDAETDLFNAATNARKEKDKGKLEDQLKQCRAGGDRLTKFADFLALTPPNLTEAEKIYRTLKAEYERLEDGWKFHLDLFRDLSKRPDSVTEEDFTNLKGSMSSINVQPWQRVCTELMRWCDVQSEYVTFRSTYTRRGREGEAPQIRRFKSFIVAKKIPVDLTEYSKTKWPDDPDELWAEAFSFFKVDPDALEEHSSDLHQYFVSGQHLIKTE